jgi:HK97 family phage major capsid protein
MSNLKFETRSALPIETREGGGDDPIAAAVAAVEEIRTAQTAFVQAQAQASDALRGEIRSLTDRLTAAETRLNRPGAGGGTQPTEPTVERRAFAAYLRHGPAAPAEEIRALTVSSDAQGGYFAPAELSTEFIRELVEVSPVRSVASVRTTGAPSVIYPKRTSGTNATWKGEAQGSDASGLGLGQAEVPIREVNTFVDISNQLLADSGGQAEAEVRMALAEDFGKKEATAFVSGSGPLAPEGFMSNADIAFTANGHATVLQPDALINLLYALPATYRNAGRWAMNGTTLAAIRKMKDGQGNYLWQPAYVAGQPETILGRPVLEMIDMPDVADGAFPIIYGDFAGYRIVDRVGLSILVNPYLLASSGMTRIHATRRVGGAVLQAARFRKLKMAV